MALQPRACPCCFQEMLAFNQGLGYWESIKHDRERTSQRGKGVFSPLVLLTSIQGKLSSRWGEVQGEKDSKREGMGRDRGNERHGIEMGRREKGRKRGV